MAINKHSYYRSGKRKGRPKGSKNKTSAKLRKKPPTLASLTLKYGRALVKKKAKADCPYVSGRLKKSISVRALKKKHVIKLRTKIKYAHFVPVLVGGKRVQSGELSGEGKLDDIYKAELQQAFAKAKAEMSGAQ